METIETIILRNLVHNDGFTRRVLPFLSEEYFKDRNERAVYGLIRDHVHRYNKAPNKDALGVALENRGGLSEQAYKDCKTIVTTITGAAPTDDTDWLLHETEKFCKDKAVYNAIIRSIEIIDGKSQNETKNAIPNILSDALSVSFDQQIGHDYFTDADDRFDFYHRVEHKIPFDLDMFNKITNGGVPNKTLNVILAGTGVGKSLFMCHHAANCYAANLNRRTHRRKPHGCDDGRTPTPAEDCIRQKVVEGNWEYQVSSNCKGIPYGNGKCKSFPSLAGRTETKEKLSARCNLY
jgi:replicative DNA helicase